MTKRLLLALALLAAFASCSGDAATTSTAAPSLATVTMSSTSLSTTEPTTTSTTTTTTATATAATTTVTVEWPATPVLPDGRPTTFVAVTDDYRAVEVDTATGDIIHVFGQTGTPEEMAAAEEMPPNVLVGAWRSLHGENFGLSDCCEPAAGRLFFVGNGEMLGDDPYSSSGEWNQGWTLSPSPNNSGFASLGYALQIGVPGVADTIVDVWIDEPSLGFPGGVVAWARDASQVWWTTEIQEVAALATLELPDGDPSHVTVLPWVGAHQFLDGIGTQASGNLVGFLHTHSEGFEVIESEGVVFSVAGELLASFPVETNSLWGGYDQAGRFLIYIDGDNTVRWQGLGMSGALADGFIHASW